MTDQDHAKIVREARVTQADREAAEAIYDKLCEQFQVRRIKAMAPDDDDLVQAFTRHRLAAEAAAFEKAAGVALREVHDEGNGAAVKANAGIIYQDILELAGEKR